MVPAVRSTAIYTVVTPLTTVADICTAFSVKLADLQHQNPSVSGRPHEITASVGWTAPITSLSHANTFWLIRRVSLPPPFDGGTSLSANPSVPGRLPTRLCDVLRLAGLFHCNVKHSASPELAYRIGLSRASVHHLTACLECLRELRKCDDNILPMCSVFVSHALSPLSSAPNHTHCRAQVASPPPAGISLNVTPSISLPACSVFYTTANVS